MSLKVVAIITAALQLLLVLVLVNRAPAGSKPDSQEKGTGADTYRKVFKGA